MVSAFEQVREFRRRQNDSYNFNWLLRVPYDMQLPFEVTHASMRALQLQRAAAGAPAGRQSAPRFFRHRHRQRQGERRGGDRAPRTVRAAADPEIMPLLDELLTAFVAQRRMKLPGSVYRPCYRLVSLAASGAGSGSPRSGSGLQGRPSRAPHY